MKPIQSITVASLRRLITLLLAIISLYIIAAFAGALLTANISWEQPDDGIDIYIETNGIHVSIILPLHQDKGILSNKLQASHMENPEYHTQYAMIGWGHKGVYQNAQSWNDLTFSDAASAALGTGDALMHIYYRSDPKPNDYRTKIRISHKQYLHILRNISGYFKYYKGGKLGIYKGYASNNIFYEANGNYNAFNTCNVWVGKILREAGIKVGYWTPISQSIMYHY